MSRATCRGCGAPILWIKTTAGRAMPCDPVVVSFRPTPEGKDKIVTPEGKLLSGEIVPSGDGTDVGYRPHWAICPQAGRFKKGGRA